MRGLVGWYIGGLQHTGLQKGGLLQVDPREGCSKLLIVGILGHRKKGLARARMASRAATEARGPKRYEAKGTQEY